MPHKVYILTQNGVFHSVFVSDERAWTYQDICRTQFPQHKWEVFGSMLIN